LDLIGFVTHGFAKHAIENKIQGELKICNIPEIKVVELS